MKTLSIEAEKALLSKAVRYCFLAEVNTNDGSLFYDFAESLNGFTDTNIDVTQGDGYVLLTSNASDPIWRGPNGPEFSGSTYREVIVEIKRVSGTGWDGQLFYVTGGHGESGSFRKQLSEPDWSDEWTTLIFDMANLTVGGTDWIANLITSIRLDFGMTVADVFQVRSVRLRDPTRQIGLTHFWSGVGKMRYDSYDWIGLGLLGRISGMGETAEVRIVETRYEMSGVASENPEISKFLDQPIRGYIAKTWFALLDENYRIIPDPIQIDETILDTATTVDAEDGTSTLVLIGESAIFNYRRPKSLAITHEQHQLDFPGSTGMSRIPTEVADKTISWTET